MLNLFRLLILILLIPTIVYAGSITVPAVNTNLTTSGNTSTLATTSGTLSDGTCSSWNSGNLISTGSPCGSGGGVITGGTITAASINQLAYYTSTSTLAGTSIIPVAIQLNITQTGTITAGTWQATAVDLASYSSNFPLLAPSTHSSSYTLVSSDNGKVVEMTCSSACVVTVPSALSNNMRVNIVQIGTGSIQIQAGSSTTVSSSVGVSSNNGGSPIYLAGQYQGAFLYNNSNTLGASIWIATGNLAP